MRIAVVNETTVVPPGKAQAMVYACVAQLRDEVAVRWDRHPPTVRLFKSLDRVPGGWRICTILDDADEAGALGYHDETPDGRPYARVFARTVLNNGGTLTTGPNSVSVTLSHELCELFIDPNIELWADDGGKRMIAYEVGDPVEASAYPKTRTILAGSTTVAVSNFVLPSWFDAQDQTGPWDHLGLLKGPRTMLPGGYVIVRAGGAVTDTFAKDVLVEGGVYPAWRTATKLAPAARTLARIR